MIVVFDTNAYLYLANNGTSENIRQRVDILKQAEAKYSEPIHALICDTVAEELLSHLCSPMSEDDKLRFGAAQAMYFHCGNKDNFGLLPQLWVQLAKELVDSVMQYAKIENYEIVKIFTGAELEGVICKHPFLDRDSRVVLGSDDTIVVELGTGTGAVHTAPGYGV